MIDKQTIVQTVAQTRTIDRSAVIHKIEHQLLGSLHFGHNVKYNFQAVDEDIPYFV